MRSEIRNGVLVWNQPLEVRSDGCGQQHTYNVGSKEKFGADYHPMGLERLTKRDGEICHFFVTDGEIEFCGDSTHALSGKNVQLPEIPARG
jgi:hypothetical protein